MQQNFVAQLQRNEQRIVQLYSENEYVGALANLLRVKSKNFTALSRLRCTLVVYPRSVFLDNPAFSNCPKCSNCPARQLIFQICPNLLCYCDMAPSILKPRLCVQNGVLASDDASDSICISLSENVWDRECLGGEYFCHNMENAAECSLLGNRRLRKVRTRSP